MATCLHCNAPSEGAFCSHCGAKMPSTEKTRPKRASDRPAFAVLILGLIVAAAALLPSNLPINHSDVTHHAAVNTAFFSSKAYDER